jgi:hypothetical protein
MLQRTFFGMAAGLGLVLFPIATAFAFARHAAVFVLGRAPILIVFLSLAIGRHYAPIFGGGFIGGVVGTLLTASLLTGLFVGLGPMIWALSALRSLVSAPLLGLRKGWREGFGPLFSSVFKLMYETSLRELILGSGLIAIVNNTTTETTTTTMIQQLTEGFTDAVVNQARQPITDEKFNAMQLQAAETQAWRVTPLTEAELATLEGLQASDTELSSALQTYKDLGRLDTDDCPIAMDHPKPPAEASRNVVLLFKQYKNSSNEWLPVPNVAHIFMKDELKTGFVGTDQTRGDARHPMSREPMIEPPAYVANGQSYPTRYRFHAYYNNDGIALSQERAEKIGYLRAKLILAHQNQDAPVDEENRSLSNFRAA